MQKVITFEVEDKSIEEYETRFDMIKECARRKIVLPDGVNPDRVDVKFYELLVELYGNWKKGYCSEEDTVTKGKNYRNMYVADKGIYSLYMKNAADMCRRRKAFTQISAALIKGEYGAVETFNKLFELLAMATEDDVTANKVRETAGFQILTGCGKHTEEELKELFEMYGYTYHGKSKANEGKKEQVKKDA